MRSTSQTTTPLHGRDAAWVAGLIALVGSQLVLAFEARLAPFEDAAMLMRYAEHLASGYGIVWNIGSAPVDGATDFLFMVLAAFFTRLGLSVEAAVRVIGIVSHTLTVLIVYFGARRLHGASRGLAAGSAAFLAVGPGLRYVEAYFGTPLFALLAGSTWYLGVRLIQGRTTRRRVWLFAGAALCTGLIRPEGVLLSVFILMSVVFARGLRRSATIIACFAGVFIVAGGAYLLWRIWYFGHLLPNPFYAKGGGQLHPQSLLNSVRHTATLALPFLVLLPYALLLSVVGFVRDLDRSKLRRLLTVVGGSILLVFLLGLVRTSNRDMHPWLFLGRYSPQYLIMLCGVGATACVMLLSARFVDRAFGRVLPNERQRQEAFGQYAAHVRRWTAVILIPTVGFTLIWVLIWDVMNYWMRFQYALLPILCMSWPTLFVGVGSLERVSRWRRHRTFYVVTVAFGLLVLTGAAAAQRALMSYEPRYEDGRYDMALMLERYAMYEYSMATTEAGLLPLYSKWKAIDLWGYNDSWIAHHAQVTSEYLDRYHPELVIMAAEFPLVIMGNPPWGSWYSVLGTVRDYAKDNAYVLAAAYGDGKSKVHYYYVRRGFPHSNELIDRIRNLDYAWYLTGHRSTNYVLENAP